MRSIAPLVLAVGLATTAVAADLAVTPQWEATDWVDRTDELEIRLNRPPAADDGEIRVFLDTLDVTELFILDGDVLRSDPTVSPLPSGRQELVVRLAPPEGEWLELGRFPVAILYPGGFEDASVAPTIQVDGQGQLDEGHDPENNAPPRETFFDTTVRLGLRTDHGREGLRITSEVETLWVSRQESALRFGSEGDDAPEYDLARYHVRLETDALSMEAGHVFVGEQPQLIEGFTSRGLAASWRPLDWLTLGGAGVNGTNIVGWDNFFGLSRSEHHVVTASVGIEAVPSRPGALSLVGTWLDASILPLTSFNQGAITDAEESSGWGVRLRGSDPSQRLQVDAGYSESTFTNPEDRELSQGVDLVPVREVTRSARFARATYQLLQGLKLSETQQMNLSLGYRHERVDPLYRSPTAFTQVDIDRHRFEGNATIGAVSLAGSYTRTEDNLDDIASILSTKTYDKDANLAVPLQRLLAPSSPSPWWPTLSASYRQTHQYGLGVPEDGGFSPTHVPDQYSKNRSAGVDWQGARWRAGYRFSDNLQDSRQEGRENADFESLAHTVSAGFSPGGGFDLGLDLAFEEAENIELAQTEDTVRVGGSVRWQIGAGHSLDLRASRTDSDNDDTGSSRESIEGDVTWSWRLQLGTVGQWPVSGRIFLRYANRQSLTVDPTFDLFDDRLLWTITTGLNLSWGS